MGNTSNFDNENQKKNWKIKKKKKNILVTCRILEKDEQPVFEIIKNHPRYYIETSNDKNQITEYLKIKKIREVGKIWCCDKRLKKKKKKNESWYKRRSSNELKKKKC